VTVGSAPTELGLPPRPRPDPAVLAAIAAAVEEAWPKPQPPTYEPTRDGDWRFSGRWWVRPVPFRRERPWTR
jgi:hypothetical protein